MSKNKRTVAQYVGTEPTYGLFFRFLPLYHGRHLGCVNRSVSSLTASFGYFRVKYALMSGSYHSVMSVTASDASRFGAAAYSVITSYIRALH